MGADHFFNSQRLLLLLIAIDSEGKKNTWIFPSLD